MENSHHSDFPEKLNWIHDICSDKAWNLSKTEKQQLLGVESVSDLEVPDAVLEELFATLFRIQRALDEAYHDPTFQKEAAWLRRRQFPLDDVSPLVFVDGNRERLKILMQQYLSAATETEAA